jgi:predicted transcriptional regulator
MRLDSAPLHWRRSGSRLKKDSVEVKQAVRALLDRLPDDCSVDDVLYRLYVLQAVARGQADVAAGRTIPHEEVEQTLRRKRLRGAAGQSGLSKPAACSTRLWPTSPRTPMRPRDVC